MDFPRIPISEKYFADLELLLNHASNEKELYEAIVNAPFYDKPTATMLGLGIVVLLLVNPKTNTIDRISLARTEMARGTTSISSKRFEDIKIPLENKENYIAIAIRSGHYMITSDWQYLFTPELTPEDARFNQAGGGIACSAVYPLNNARAGGAIIFSYFEPVEKIEVIHHQFMKKYSDLVAKALRK